MKNILLILVGGTICTNVNEKGTLSVCEGAGVRLKEDFLASGSFYADKVNIVLSENLFILSENMTVENLNRIISLFRKEIKKADYDGVIFAHGTDTLAYTASLFSFILADCKIPIFFVSSNKRLDLEDANGNDNFKAAVECICRKITPNVYVSYKNLSDNKMYLHLGSHIKQCENYSDDFYSIDKTDITDINEQNYTEYFKIIENKYPTNLKNPLIKIDGDWTLKNNVLYIMPYVSINYEAFDYRKFKAILHGSYHSGTACVESKEQGETYGENSILKMIDLATASGADIYFSPAKREGEIYDTVRVMSEHRENNISFLYGTTNEAALTKLILAYSYFEKREDIKNFLNTQCNFENAYK